MSLCFSPKGEGLRAKSRKFPALVNCTVIDWFQDWPYDALRRVADKFLGELELGTDEAKDMICEFMPFSLNNVNKFSDKIFTTDRRYV